MAFAEKFFGDDNIDWILQEDNDPKYKSKIYKKWKEKNGVKTLPWLSILLNQNPIENVWRLLKIKISKKKFELSKG